MQPNPTTTATIEAAQHVEAALDALIVARAELIAAQALTVTTPIADMLAGVNTALAAHLTAALAPGSAK
ncbi:hypothetical protein [Mycolicibacter sinensis]